MNQWILKPKISKEASAELSDYEPLIAQLLFNKGLFTKKAASEFLDTSPANILDAATLGEMAKAVKRINEAISKKQKIFIHGDFDVDGVTATTILWGYLYKIRNANVLPYIPHKVDEGYGMSEATLEMFVKEKADLVITVDCGIRDVELVKKYQGKPFDIIITDHHEPGSEFPSAFAVVHPKHPTSKYKFDRISGGVVAWKLVSELEKTRLKNIEWQNIYGADLIAISTVCDVMPLISENRSLVMLGLECMRSSSRKGLSYLASVSGVQLPDIDTYHLGFVIGPRINAAGRLDHAMEAVRLFLTDNDGKARTIADKLNNLNIERQRITEELLTRAILEVEKLTEIPNLIILKGSEWPEGIIGLIAGRLTEKYYRPSIVLSENAKGEITGSARSISDFNIVETIESLKEYLTSYGGHPQAAGLRLEAAKFDAFQIAAEAIAAKSDPSIFQRKLMIDVEVIPEDISMEVIEKIDQFKPFGFGNARPNFLLKDLTYVDGKVIGKDSTHFKGVFAGSTGQVIEAIGFNKAYSMKGLSKGQKIDIVGNLEINEFGNNKTIQLNITEISLK
jgi:single-stranded-DNA-specific exonuclease